MRVLAYDPNVGEADIAAAGAVKVPDWRLALGDADVISLHLPRLPETENMIGAAEFAAMKPGAILVNTSRGGIVDERALADALRAGRIGGAGLDVFDEEPPPKDHPLFAFDRVLLSPHIAGLHPRIVCPPCRRRGRERSCRSRWPARSGARRQQGSARQRENPAPMKKPLRVGLIGSGFMGRSHAHAFRAAPGVFDLPLTPVLELLADVDDAIADNAAKTLGFARSTGDWKTLIADPAVDLVDITAPNALHKPIALAAIAAGKPVYCEKPLAPNAAEAKEMADAAAKAGVEDRRRLQLPQEPDGGARPARSWRAARSARW